MDDIVSGTKPGTDAIEYVKPGPLQQLPLPAELASWSEDEVKELEKGLVRRLDSCLLPSVVILFLMNILDRCVFCIHVSKLRLSISINSD